MRVPVAAAAAVAVLALAACGGSSSSSQSTPKDVCTHMVNIAGMVKNLSTGISSGEASLDAITYTTKQLRTELQQLGEAAKNLNNPAVADLQESFHQFRLAYGRIPPGSTASETRAALKAPAADVKASWQKLVDSLSCKTG